ncbi:formylglycine-generating enzyme family protein [bacterium]|nr:formylglycine-generating enzyme family protein [bacterium]
MIDINKTTAKYLVLDLTTFEMREEEKGPMEDPNILKDDKCRTTELWLRRIEPGTFMMGSPEGEIGRRDDEEQHEVTLTNPFYIGVFEITQKQYELITGNNPSNFIGDTKPLENVCYDMIQGSAKNANKNENNKISDNSFLSILRSKIDIPDMKFSLPTEAQWEYACRAGSITAINSEKDLSPNQQKNMDEVGRCKENAFICSDNNNKEKIPLGTAVVGSFLPNQWGLYDMHGNVWEWCLDSYDAFDKYDDDVVEYAIDPVYLDNKNRCCVLRGGCYSSEASECRSAKRKSGYRSMVEENPPSGFRVVLNQQTNGEMRINKPMDTIEINKFKPKYLVLDLETYKIREEEKGPMEDPNILNNDKCRTTELWLKRIECGTFIMGSPENEQYRKSDEQEHKVKLTKSFYIGVFTITQGQYKMITGHDVLPRDVINHLGDTRPFETSFYNIIRGQDNNVIDQTSILGIFRSKSHLNFDLPTEAQWEYACRANTRTPWNNGEDFELKRIFVHYDDINGSLVDCDAQLDKLGRYERNRNDGRGGNYLEHTKVGSYDPNAWGLYDMHGNVCELCLDMYQHDIFGDNKNPLFLGGRNHVGRGGDYRDEFQACRSAKRFRIQTGNGVGFRVVLIREKIFLSIKNNND